MTVLRNTRADTFDFSLSKEYDGIGTTLSVRPKERTIPLPDEIKDEKWIDNAIKKGILVVEEEARAEESAPISEDKKSFKKKFIGEV